MSKLKIGLVCPYRFDYFGGVANHTLALGDALTNLGFKIIYISPTPKRNIKHTHIQIGHGLNIPTPNGSTATLSLTFESRKKIKEALFKQKLNLLHFQDLYAPAISWQLLQSSPYCNVATFHSGWEKNSQIEMMQPLFTNMGAFFAPYLSASITVSATAAWCNRNAITKNNQTIPVAINLLPYTKPFPKPKSLNNSKMHLTYIGRLDKRKGVKHLIHTLPLIHPRILNQLQVNIIGSGTEDLRLKQITNKLELHNQIIFYNSVSDKLKYSYLQHSDVFISPALYGESFGISLVEAMAAGLPIIAGNNRGYSELLANYPWKSALVSPTNHSHFARTIEALVDKPALRHTLKNWGKLTAKRYDATQIAKKHLSFYQSTLENYYSHPIN